MGGIAHGRGVAVGAGVGPGGGGDGGDARGAVAGAVAVIAADMSPAEAFAAGVARGRRLAALEIGLQMRQLGLDIIAAGHRGGEVVLGNATGPGSLAALRGER